jgi:hypothetical protein
MTLARAGGAPVLLDDPDQRLSLPRLSQSQFLSSRDAMVHAIIVPFGPSVDPTEAG